MSLLKRGLRRFALWGIPFIVLVLLLLGSFLYWIVASQAGTRWVLHTALPYAHGTATGVRGTLWSGLTVEHLSVNLPDTQLDVSSLELRVNWRELLERRLHVLALTAEGVDLALTTPAEPKVQEEPFSIPTLPLSIAVDKLELGRFSMQQDGQAIPVQLSDLSAAISAGPAGGQVRLYKLAVAQADIEALVTGELDLGSLQAPYPVNSTFQVQANAVHAQSPLCLQHHLPEFSLSLESPSLDAGQLCQLTAQIKLAGSLEQARLDATVNGQGISADAHMQLTPSALAPVTEATFKVILPDDSALTAGLTWDARRQDGVLQDHLQGQFESRSLDLRKLAGVAAQLPDALLLGEGSFDLRLFNREQLDKLSLKMNLNKGSRWNQQALQGLVDVQAHSRAEPGDPYWWRTIQVADSVVDVRLGANQIQAKGSFGQPDSQLSVLALVPHAAALWPGLELGKLQAKASVKGNIEQHALDIKVDYDLGGAHKEQVGQGPVHAQAQMQGKWAFATQAKSASWEGRIAQLDVQHAGMAAKLESALPLLFKVGQAVPDIQAQSEAQQAQHAATSNTSLPWSVKAGATRLRAYIGNKPWIYLDHAASEYDGKHWSTRGSVHDMVLSEARLTALQRRFGLQQDEQEKKGGVKLASRTKREPVAIEIQAHWDLAFAGALKGSLEIERVSGDIMVPADPSFPLGLQQLALQIQATPTQGGRSKLDAKMDVRTEKMGYVTVQADTVLHATEQGGLILREQDPKVVQVQAHIDDLGWTSLFLGDAMELGGKLNADLRIDIGEGWKWTSQGTLSGSDLRFTLLDEGVRLLNGSLAASFENDTFRLDKLYFPASLRVEPHEWRTATWINENPDAKGGGLTVTGQWNLSDQRGNFLADIYRFPILQRADRYAMISGQLTMDMNLPQIAIGGKVTADAGWFNLDMLGGIPSVDGDVVVVRGDYVEQSEDEPEGVQGMSMEIDVDLGPRFYLTGYGVNSGLVGSVKVSMIGGRITGIGILRTRGGRVELYGQKLLLRRGMVTFQGDITAPILDIEALRSGLAVQAGVKVGGTARKPRIDLVSYPDVAESEKLSWLLLGHGSDHSGGDLGLLLSVGTSFLGDGEPFYRRFGIDEIAMESGDLGSVGSILPVQNVVPSLEQGVSPEERRFVTISKAVSSNITLSLQQALSDTGTVGRASYRLARGLTAELSAGTVNGLALIYRWFSSD